MALDGRTLCLTFFPSNYVKERQSHWSTHPDIKYIDSIRGKKIESVFDEEMPSEDKRHQTIEESSDEFSEEEILCPSRN